MPERELYDILEKMVYAAEKCDRDEVLKINNKFSAELDNTFRYLPNYSINDRRLMYDRTRNRACDSVTNFIDRESILQEMRERFSKIPKPK